MTQKTGNWDLKGEGQLNATVQSITLPFPCNVHILDCIAMFEVVAMLRLSHSAQ